MRKYILFLAILILCYSFFQKYFGTYLFRYNSLVTVVDSQNTESNQSRLLQDNIFIRPKIQKIHNQLCIIDMHADTSLWDINILTKNSDGHVDLPRLKEGNITLQVFSAVTKISYDLLIGESENVQEIGDPITTIIRGAGWPKKTYNNYLQRSLFHSKKMHTFAEESNGELKIITSREDLQSLISARDQVNKPVGALLALEGVYTENGTNDFDDLFKAGFRMASLTHFLDNRFAGASNGVKKSGLTEEGKEFVRLMQKNGMLVDVSHISTEALNDILKITKKPVVRSHGGVKGKNNCGGNRNLNDSEIIAIANTKGVIGIGFWPEVICGNKPSDIAKVIKYTVDLLNNSDSFQGQSGVNHVGLGSDFDGLVTTPFDVAHLGLLTQELSNIGFSEQEIKKIAGGNVLRVLEETLP